jgi:hypothetical protein
MKRRHTSQVDLEKAQLEAMWGYHAIKKLSSTNLYE